MPQNALFFMLICHRAKVPDQLNNFSENNFYYFCAESRVKVSELFSFGILILGGLLFLERLIFVES